ncbi:MAG: helix-turn-helix domain-containing protein [Actinomycetota bacterium]
MHRAETQRRCPACGTVVDPASLAAPVYACPSCWTGQKPEGELEQPIRLVTTEPEGPPPSPAASDDVRPPPGGEGERAPAERTTTVADVLRTAREARGVTIEQASAATRIPQRYLVALEDDAPLSTYPARTYARSFLREYARALAIEDAPLVGRFDTEHPDTDEDGRIVVVPESAPRVPGRRRRVVMLILALAALAAIVVSFQPWTSSTPSALPAVPAPVPQDEGGTGSDPAQEAGPAENGGPVNEQPVDEPGSSGEGFRGVYVRLKVLERSWVEATTDGEQRLAEALEAGRSLTLRARDELDLLLGNPSGVRLRVGGERVPLRADGEVVELSLAWNGQRVTGLD